MSTEVGCDDGALRLGVRSPSVDRGASARVDGRAARGTWPARRALAAAHLLTWTIWTFAQA
eukprot:2435752-Pyramimonas_sp.AAC.1